jgi:hypothetical protein
MDIDSKSDWSERITFSEAKFRNDCVVSEVSMGSTSDRRSKPYHDGRCSGLYQFVQCPNPQVEAHRETPEVPVNNSWCDVVSWGFWMKLSERDLLASVSNQRSKSETRASFPLKAVQRWKDIPRHNLRHEAPCVQSRGFGTGPNGVVVSAETRREFAGDFGLWSLAPNTYCFNWT